MGKLGPYEVNTIVAGDCLEVLRQIPDGIFQCAVCSPPYWNLRDYGIPPVVWGGDPLCEHDWRDDIEGPVTTQYDNDGRQKVDARNWSKGVAKRKYTKPQHGNFCRKCSAWLGSLGLEPTPKLYVEHIVEVFREVRRVLRDDGTLWLNMGDSYNSGTSGDRRPSRNAGGSGYGKHGYWANPNINKRCFAPTLKPKDLIGIPWRVALALQADGWWLRRDIIWAKGRDGEDELYEEIGPGSSMPGSAKDRPISTHEYVFLLSKSARYYYDHSAVRVKWPGGSHELRSVWFINTQSFPGELCTYCKAYYPKGWRGLKKHTDEDGKEHAICPQCHHWDSWLSHFATFSPKLVEPMIKAGTSEQGACPECGKAWVRVVERGPATHNGKTASAYQSGTSANRLALLRQAARERGGEYANVAKTIGWQPACSCGLLDGFQPDDFEVIETPTGKRIRDDPSLVTGRAGYDRPRGPNEGQRPITRYEQRKYAEQLRNSPRCAEMERQAGSAFEHYIRTDKSGARPIPPGLLEAWLEQDWLEQVQVPEWRPPTSVPCLVLDPFAGAGTTLMVADRLKRDWLGIDINPDYAVMSEQRIGGDRKKRAQLALF